MLKAGDRDPQDARLQLLKVGEIPPECKIFGGECELLKGSSPRVYITAQNKNVKFSAEVFVANDVKEIYLVARSNHEDRPDGFGGYYYYLNFHDKKAYFKKEQTHTLGYSPRLNEKAIDFQKGKWYKAELYILNDDKNVKLEGYFDGFPLNDWLDDGTEKGPAFTDFGKWAFLRANDPNGVRYRNVKIEPVFIP